MNDGQNVYNEGSSTLQGANAAEYMVRGNTEDVFINIESGNTEVRVTNSGRGDMQSNILSLFNTQLSRQRSYPGDTSRQSQRRLEHHQSSSNAHSHIDTPQQIRPVRSWRMNLNDVISFSTAPSTEALRSLITHSSNFRYAPLNANDDGHETAIAESANDDLPQNNHPPNDSASNALRLNMRTTARTMSSQSEGSLQSTPIMSGDVSPAATNDRQSNLTPSNVSNLNRNEVVGDREAGDGGNVDIDDDNNVISDLVVKILSHFVRYLPFICILFVKFVHDHLLGILDLLVLHAVMFQMNKSVRARVAKLPQKSYLVLLRDFGLVLFIVVYRFILSSTEPNFFGLLIPPPLNKISVEVSPISRSGVDVAGDEHLAATQVLSNYLSRLTSRPKTVETSNTDFSAVDPNTVSATKAIPIGLLLYYIAINDLILKLITILLKISIAMLPTQLIRQKATARLFVLCEYFSQFYRALAPIQSWLLFLFASYSGLEVISGVLFSSFYMGAKAFELIERGKTLKKAFVNFVRNMDYERKPTKEESDAAGSVCPICHDSYNTPIVLECGHMFCDDCVSTWFKREQTCPMCRAKVNDDPTWRDGSTTFFYQIF